MFHEPQHLSDEELAYWLAFDALPGTKLGSPFVIHLYERFGDIRDAWRATYKELKERAELAHDRATLFIDKRSEIDPEDRLEALRATGVEARPFSAPNYPYKLREITNPPAVLYVRGDINDFEAKALLAVVGTRKPTAYGQKMAKEISRDLAANGAVVVSGLALGVDSIAHWGAIEGGGKTVAVVANGPDLCYPYSNRRLYDQIVNGRGAIVSEYFPGTTPEKWHFPARNRILSGLCKATIVVEAGESSGALITANLAFQQSRDVFAIPGRADSPMSKGTNKLIREHVAMLADGAAQVLDSLNWVRTKVQEATTIVELYGREKELYELLSHEPVHFDMLCHLAGMDVGETSATLTMLELAGLVTRQTGDWYSRNQGSGTIRHLPMSPNPNQP